MTIPREYVRICWQCENGHTNQTNYRYDTYEGTVREVVNGFIFDPGMIDDHPCTICRTNGFYNITYYFNSYRVVISEPMMTEHNRISSAA